MKVYKFGGASVRSAEGVRNLCDIVSTELVYQLEHTTTGDCACFCDRHDDTHGHSHDNKSPDPKGLGYSDGLFVIVSAMGKTTNTLETITEAFVSGDKVAAYEALDANEKYHRGIIEGLFGKDGRVDGAERLFVELRDMIANPSPADSEYDLWYDRIVSYGELLSTTIISEYLASEGLSNTWVDMRKSFVTDDRHRDANIDIEASTPLLLDTVKAGCTKLFIGQGFIGGTAGGETTTLGREGSDYSAAVAAYILDADSVTIWKDVEGILNADPKIFSDTCHIPELTYLDAIELAYSGAQIIHPKTIKPLQNKNIPLLVRPFGDKAKPGSIIKGEIAAAIEVPILILKHNQVLLSIRPNDFSFVLEDTFASIFALMECHNIKVNLIQSSAVNLSVSVDNSRLLPEVVETLKERQFRVVYNDGMELLTIRGYTPELYDKYESCDSVYLTQKTRRTVRIVRKKM